VAIELFIRRNTAQPWVKVERRSCNWRVESWWIQSGCW